MTISLANINLFLLVFMRMTGFVIFNPIFQRSSVPTLLKGAFSLLCAFLITPTLSVSTSINGVVQMTAAAITEFIVGIGIGVICNMFFNVVTMAGEMIDMQMGLGLATMYEPGSGVTMPVMGNFLNIVVMLVFFTGNAHLTLLSLVADSYRLILPGNVFPTAASSAFIVNLGGDMFELALRLAIPVIAVEIVGIVAVALLMRVVPQVNIFTVGIQIEIIIGIVVILLAASPLTSLCDQLVSFILEKSAEFIRLLAA